MIGNDHHSHPELPCCLRLPGFWYRFFSTEHFVSPCCSASSYREIRCAVHRVPPALRCNPGETLSGSAGRRNSRQETRLETCVKNRDVRCVGCTVVTECLPVVKRAAGQIMSDRRTHLRQNNQNSLEVQNHQNFLADQGPCQAIQM